MPCNGRTEPTLWRVEAPASQQERELCCSPGAWTCRCAAVPVANWAHRRHLCSEPCGSVRRRQVGGSHRAGRCTSAASRFAQLLTHVLVHADLWHLLGNMWFLFCFGNAVNAKLGHAVYLTLYFCLGAVAGLAWVAGRGRRWSAPSAPSWESSASSSSLPQQRCRCVVLVRRDRRDGANPVVAARRLLDGPAIWSARSCRVMQ